MIAQFFAAAVGELSALQLPHWLMIAGGVLSSAQSACGCWAGDEVMCRLNRVEEKRPNCKSGSLHDGDFGFGWGNPLADVLRVQETFAS